MEERKHRNRVAGAWAPPRTGIDHEVTAAGGAVLGRWPRSGAEDLELALEAALGAARDWRELRHVRRVALLRQGLEAVVRARSLDRALAERLGLPESDCVRYRRQAFRPGDAVLRRAPAGAPTRGAALVHVDARAAVAGIVEELFPSLAGGMPVVLVSDPRMPFLADELCLAMEGAGLPAGVLGVLHDDGRTVLRAAAGRPEVTRLAVRAPRALTDEVAAALRSRPNTAGPRDAPFGAGVAPGTEPALRARDLRDRTFVVRSGSDPEGAAEEVVRRAFGAAETWTGQAEGSVGRVLCHQRVFSRFSEALLEALEDQRSAGPLLPPLDPSVRSEAEERVALGLDEGATLLVGEPAGSRRTPADAILAPSVFTNAEPRMRLARPGPPAAVLVLMRCKDDAHAAALADELDGELADAERTAPGGRPQRARGRRPSSRPSHQGTTQERP